MLTWLRSLVIVGIVVLLFTGCDGKRIPITDYQQGYNAGVEEVRRARQQAGALGGASMEMVQLLGIPGNSSKSADWNAGFRAGTRAELDK